MKGFAKKGLPLLLAAFILSALLAACGSGGGDNQASDNGGAQGSGSESPDTKATGKKDINIWLWDVNDSRRQLYAEFTKLHPEYNIVLTSVQAKDMAQKLQTAMASGADLPDIAWLEQTYRGKLLSLDIWEDLSKPPYNLDKSQLLDYLAPLETTGSGVYVGPEAPSVAGMAYKRELTKKYFGTDDPAELQKIFTDWDTFIEKGKEVRQKSNGSVYMFASLGDAYQFLKGQSTTPFVNGDTLNLDQSAAPILQKLVEMKQAGIVDTIDSSSPTEGTSYTDDTHIFYPCATWSLDFTIKANDKNGVGRWGFMIPPGGPFPYGGTVQAVPAKAKNKEGAAELIKFLFMSEKGAELMRDIKGNFSPYKPVYDIPNFYSHPDDYFAGQDVLKAFQTEVFPNIKSVRLPSKYDQDIDDAINIAIQTINSSPDGNVKVEDLIKKMVDDIKNKQPDIKV